MSQYRYERSQKQAAFGRSLVQRHVALPEDIANEAGEGLLVSVSHVDCQNKQASFSPKLVCCMSHWNMLATHTLSCPGCVVTFGGCGDSEFAAMLL